MDSEGRAQLHRECQEVEEMFFSDVMRQKTAEITRVFCL